MQRLFEDLDPYLPELQAQADDLTDTSSPALVEAKDILLSFIHQVDEQKLVLDQPFLSFFVSEGYLDVVEAFLIKAKKEDDQLNNTELFQAMRNIWIMNSLQMVWGLPLTLTTPMYAYSMLYPYTDNLLDDPDIDSLVKSEFNRKLGMALTGETVTPSSTIESRVFDLVEQILTDFPVECYPRVTESIQLIHEAQIDSMKQSDAAVLPEEEVVKISLFKGGTSVLADAFLIKGALDEREMTFAFHYGAFLQLIDDLQDKESDEQARNQTLFTADRTPEGLEQSIRKLLSYIFTVNSREPSDNQITLRMKDIISRCTLIMVMESVGRHPHSVTPSFYKELESYSNIDSKRLKHFSNSSKPF